jgi:hypothetical protein
LLKKVEQSTRQLCALLQLTVNSKRSILSIISHDSCVALSCCLQLSKSDKELKALRLKLKQACARLDKMQAAAAKVQEMAAGMVADAQAGMALD